MKNNYTLNEFHLEFLKIFLFENLKWNEIFRNFKGKNFQ